MKLLVAIVLHAENNTAGTAGPNQGSASLSYEELSALTDLSRAMIAAGLKLLAGQDLLIARAEGRGRRKRYFLRGFGPSDAWAKVPNQPLFRYRDRNRIAVLHELSCRRRADLDALKLYLLLCAFRDTSANRAIVGYTKIRHYTGIPEGRVRRAISVLVEHGLVQVERDKPSDETEGRPNRYEILGLASKAALSATSAKPTRIPLAL